MDSMITTVTKKNTVAIPAEIRRRYGVKPGYRLEWRAGEAADEIRVRFIPERGVLARRLLGAGRCFSPERDAVAELIAERTVEG